MCGRVGAAGRKRVTVAIAKEGAEAMATAKLKTGETIELPFEETRERLEEIAEQYDCLYGGKPWIAGLFAKIGNGELIIVPAPPKAK
jgi:hypothetical protein